MAYLLVKQKSLTGSDARGIMATPSMRKRPCSLVDQDGNEHMLDPREDDFLEQFKELALQGEKAMLLGRKDRGELKGPIRDTQRKFGTPKEWDYLIVSFDKEESVELSDIDKELYRTAILEALSDPDDYDGHRMVLIADGHDETNNFHFHILSHRHVVDNEKKKVTTSLALDKDTYAAPTLDDINRNLEKVGLRPLTEWVNARGEAISEDKSVSNEIKKRVSKNIEEAGGVPSLDVTPTVSPAEARAQKEAQKKLSPEEQKIRQFINFHQRESQSYEKKAQDHASSVAFGQHALAALDEAQKAREELQEALKELKATSAAAEDLGKEVGGLKKQIQEATELLEKITSTATFVEAEFDKVAPVLPESIRDQSLEERAQFISSMISGINESVATAEDLLPAEARKGSLADKSFWLMEDYHKTLETLESTVQSFKKEKALKEELAANNKKLNTELSQTHKQVEVLRKDVVAFKEQEKAHKEQIKDLESTNKEMQQTLVQAQERIKSFEKQLDSASTVIEESKTLMSQQRMVLETQTKQINSLEKNLEDKDGQIDHLSGIIGAKEQDIKAKDKEFANLKSELEKVRSDFGDLRSQMEKRLKMEVPEDVKKEISDLLDKKPPKGKPGPGSGK